MELFPQENIIGIFRGLQQGDMEFRADLVLPYKSNKFQNRPMHGSFLLVQLETQEEAVLGRIASFSSEGKLSYGAGEEFSLRAASEDRDIPDDLREQYLKYRANIRVLGVLRQQSEKLVFVASHRRLPHVGSKVAFPSDEVLREIGGHNFNGAQIGNLAFGEYIYAQGADSYAGDERPDWMQILSPEVKVHFPINSLVSRRSFIFARAGFGKSNLNKLLFSKLYEKPPGVGTVLFDPDGEYFWPDNNGRPGLCDVPALENKLVVFTKRRVASRFYQSFVADKTYLDLRRFDPEDVISIALDSERQNQQNVQKLRGLSRGKWEKLVDLIAENEYSADIGEICKLLSLDKQKQEVEAIAARNNMTVIVKMLHRKTSRLQDILMNALAKGKLCVIDVSQMSGKHAMVFSGLILRRIFNKNQDDFTKTDSETMPVIAVVEEAQAVLQENASASAPYIAWVKEGRKYNLGALLITQQPGSIPTSILSQGDNWFVFHLLSAGDLSAVKKANAHFSDDLLSSLLNEPIPGNGIFWSSANNQQYPTSFRALSFESLFSERDSKGTLPAGKTYARALQGATPPVAPSTSIEDDSEIGDEGTDFKNQNEQKAINALAKDKAFREKLESEAGQPWWELQKFLIQQLPANLDDRHQEAYHLVAKAMTSIYGEQDKVWETYKNKNGKTWIKLIRDGDK